MTATNAKLAQGTQLRMATVVSGGTPNTQIAEITSISGPTMSSDLVDVTSQDSTGGFREKIIGLTDPGELSFDIFFNQTVASHNATTGLLAVFKNKTTMLWGVVFAAPISKLWTFQGVVNGFEIDAAVDDALKASVTLAVSGLPNFDAAAWPAPTMVMAAEEMIEAARERKGVF